LSWLEFNIHVRSPVLGDNVFVRRILLELIEPFVNTHRQKFSHWHYLIESDPCRGDGYYYEIRIRFEGDNANLSLVKNALINDLANYSNRTNITMREDEILGSHEGHHGRRIGGGIGPYRGAQSEGFAADWSIIVEILEKGSEFALQILSLGDNLIESRSMQVSKWHLFHPYYLHLPANQLLLE